MLLKLSNIKQIDLLIFMQGEIAQTFAEQVKADNEKCDK